MLITENVLRKIIAEEYQKLVQESSGVNMQALLTGLKGAGGDTSAVEDILNKYTFTPQDAFDIIQNLGMQSDQVFPKARDTIPVVREYFKTKGIEPKAASAYMRGSPEKEAPEGGFAPARERRRQFNDYGSKNKFR